MISYAAIKTSTKQVGLTLFRDYREGRYMPTSDYFDLADAAWECSCGCGSYETLAIQIRAEDHSVLSEHRFDSAMSALHFLQGVALAANHARFIDRAYAIRA